MQLVCWAELVFIQLAHPEASFLGHLCGILAGVPPVCNALNSWCNEAWMQTQWAQRVSRQDCRSTCLAACST